MNLNRRTILEFGDFQTPFELASQVCNLLLRKGVHPISIIEPTCGRGSFLLAALSVFKNVERAWGYEINREYVTDASMSLATKSLTDKATLVEADFFLQAWEEILVEINEPVLILGNPPWVTNSDLSSLHSKNLPQKANFKNLRGMDALTGRSNFDISEWMIIRLIEASLGKDVVLAMLCKTSVARNALEYFWSKGYPLESSSIYQIDANKYFSAAVDACLLYIDLGSISEYSCDVHSGIDGGSIIHNYGFRDGVLLSDLDAYERTKHLAGTGSHRWRSGIKHDSARIMELQEQEGALINGLGEIVIIEDQFIYPMLKSSNIAKDEVTKPTRWMIVPQKHTGENTDRIKIEAPATWQYLLDHSSYLDDRKSSIYRSRPRFSVFGVGDYSFSMWKVAISGLYKQLKFSVIPPYRGKPVVLDDTCYFLPFDNEESASFFHSLLTHKSSLDFFSSYVFWDSKRPITVRLLSKLDISKLAKDVGQEEKFLNLFPENIYIQSNGAQLTLFEKDE